MLILQFSKHFRYNKISKSVSSQIPSSYINIGIENTYDLKKKSINKLNRFFNIFVQIRYTKTVFKNKLKVHIQLNISNIELLC